MVGRLSDNTTETQWSPIFPQVNAKIRLEWRNENTYFLSDIELFTVPVFEVLWRSGSKLLHTTIHM